MPDITLCQSHECIKKEQCYRYKADPNIMQSYSNFLNNDLTCDSFISLKEYKTPGDKNE